MPATRMERTRSRDWDVNAVTVFASLPPGPATLPTWLGVAAGIGLVWWLNRRSKAV